MDKNNNILPRGVTGELCLAGPQIAAGYWKREELTAEKFSDIEVGGEKIKVYHTGDLAHYNENGDIVYCGRIDFQIKLRGFCIELGEIENRAAKFKNIGHQGYDATAKEELEMRIKAQNIAQIVDSKNSLTPYSGKVIFFNAHKEVTEDATSLRLTPPL